MQNIDLLFIKYHFIALYI